jgi:hypothetical protein
VDQTLLRAMAIHPGVSVTFLSGLVGASRGAIISRIHKLAERRLLEKCRDGHWRLSTPERPIDEDEEISEFATVKRISVPALAFDSKTWVRNINFYVIWNPDPFSWRRYG